MKELEPCADCNGEGRIETMGSDPDLTTTLYDCTSCDTTGLAIVARLNEALDGVAKIHGEVFEDYARTEEGILVTTRTGPHEQELVRMKYCCACEHPAPCPTLVICQSTREGKT